MNHTTGDIKKTPNSVALRKVFHEKYSYITFQYSCKILKLSPLSNT